MRRCQDLVNNYQQKYDEDLIAKTVYYGPLQEAKAKLKAAETAVADKLEELKGRKSQKRFLEEQKQQKLAGYEKEAAQLKSSLAASKAKHYAAINQLVRKAKANASAKFLGAKVPEGATSSYDIEAYNPPPVSAIVNEVLPGK